MSKQLRLKYRLIHHCKYCPEKYQIRISFDQVGEHRVVVGHGQHFIGRLPMTAVTNEDDWMEDIKKIYNCPHCLQSLDMLFRKYQEKVRAEHV